MLSNIGKTFCCISPLYKHTVKQTTLRVYTILARGIFLLLKHYSPTVAEGKAFILVFCNSVESIHCCKRLGQKFCLLQRWINSTLSMKRKDFCFQENCFFGKKIIGNVASQSISWWHYHTTYHVTILWVSVCKQIHRLGN